MPRDCCVRNVGLGPIAGRSCVMRGTIDEICSPLHCRHPSAKTLYKNDKPVSGTILFILVVGQWPTQAL